VTRQIGQHCLRSAEWALGIDDPFGLAQRGEISCEGLRIGQMDIVAEEAQAAGLVGGDELPQEQPAKQAGEHTDGEEEARSARYPRRKHPRATVKMPGSGLSYQTSLRVSSDARREEGAQMYDGSREDGAQSGGREEMMWLVLRWVAFIIFVGLVIITFVYE
jgi:hypothetical protein